MINNTLLINNIYFKFVLRFWWFLRNQTQILGDFFMYTSAFYFPPIRVRLLSKGRAGVWEKSCDWSLRPSVLHYRSVFTVNVNIRQNLTPWISAYFCVLHRFTTTTKKHFVNELRIIASNNWFNFLLSAFHSRSQHSRIDWRTCIWCIRDTWDRLWLITWLYTVLR